MNRRNSIAWTTVILLIAALGASLVGCSGVTPYQPPADDGFQQTTPDHVLVVVLDLSGSYASYMDGPAWSAMTAMIRQFHQEHRGDDATRIVLAQISNKPQAPIFEGTPASFGRQFGSATAFRDYLKARSDPAGSRVHSSIADAIDYSLPLVTGKGKAALAVFSDMEENWPEPEKSEARLVASLAEWGRKGGIAGFYWVELPYVAKWRGNLDRSGVKRWVVESSINTDPKLPKFDDN